eukprot:7295072-Prymnesium_polylepis.1
MAPILPLDMPRCDSDTYLRARQQFGENGQKCVNILTLWGAENDPGALGVAHHQICLDGGWAKGVASVR